MSEPAMSDPATQTLPTISVIIPNYNGRAHLDTCLASLRLLDYPRDRLEIIVVDNASSDDSVAYLENGYAALVTIIENDENRGFAGACNQGAEAASGDYVAFLNNDMRVDRAWLRELIAPILSARAEGDRALVCTGSQILSWDGEFIDFIEGRISLYGNGFQLDHGHRSILVADRTEPYEIPFACGGSMLIDRAVFLDIGALDEDFFALFEDVDLGYRLWALGMRVLLAPKALTYHKMHATINTIAFAKRERLYSRNALYFCYKNLDDANVNETLLSNVLLLIAQAGDYIAAAGVKAADYDIRSRNDLDAFVAEPTVAARIFAVQDLVRDLPKMRRKRAFIQSRRVRSDAELSHWGGMFLPHVPAQGLPAYYEIIQSFINPDRYANIPRRIVLVCQDILPLSGVPSTGFGLRIWGIGKGLESRGHTVIWMIYRDVMTRMEQMATEPVPTEWKERVWDAETIGEVLEHVSPELIVACGWPTALILPEDLRAPLIIDQAGPHNLERYFQQPESATTDTAQKIAALKRADFFVSSGEVQQTYFDGWLAMADFPRDEEGAIDHKKVGIIPFSVSPDLPTRLPRGDRPLTFTYGGYFLPWKDPSKALTTIATWATEHAAKVRIFGGRPPFHVVPPGVMGELIHELEAMPSVEFHGVLPFDALLEEYRSVDVAIDLMKRNRERELAFTTGTVVYLWAGIPVIYNNYSELSHAIAEYDAGWTLDPDDTCGLEKVLEEIRRHPDVIARKSANAQRLVRDRLTWDRTIEPLDAFCRQPSVRPKPIVPIPPAIPSPRDDGITGPPPVVFSSLAKKSATEDSTLAYIARTRRTVKARGLTIAREIAKRLLRAEQVVAYHDMLARVGPPLTSAGAITQGFTATQPSLAAIDVRFATFGRTNTPMVTATVATESGGAKQSVAVSAATFVDGAYVRFEFDTPLRDLARKRLLLTLSSPDGILGDSVAPWMRVSPTNGNEPARRGSTPLAHPVDYRPVYLPAAKKDEKTARAAATARRRQ
ncbi:MAG: glycosyltransferase [Thermomicrobiales bacterium]